MSFLYGAELAPGAWVAPWRVERLAAQGGSSLLYRVRHATSGQPAALKVLRAEYGFAPSALRRFHQEAGLLARVRHPHVVELYGSGELEDGRPWLAMEWVEGSTLAQWLSARGRLGAAEALPLVEQLCGALEAVHAAGLVHRDLHARNVLLRGNASSPRAVLVDFGIAREREPRAGSPHTSTGRVLGTPLSLSPEQIRGGSVDGRADLYALGVLLYHLLCGQPPFQGESMAELMEQHLSAPVPLLAPVAPVTPAVEAVVRRCLAKQPEERFQRAEQVLQALEAALRPGALEARAERAAALYVELVPGPEAGPAALERLDALWEHALLAVEGAGLRVSAQGAGMILALAPLPGDPELELQARARLLFHVRALGQALEDAAGDEDLRVTLTLHAGPATSEELLMPSGWAGTGPGVHATGAAREGLSEAEGEAP